MPPAAVPSAARRLRQCLHLGTLLLGLSGALPNAQASSGGNLQVGDRLPAAEKTETTRYRNIVWDDLIPKGWDPAAEFKKIPLARLRDGDPQAAEALRKLRAAWDNAPTEQSLNGQAVRLAGFVIPLERRGDFVSEFLFVPYFGACIHTPPPPANQTIHVQMKNPSRDMATMEAFWVSGTLQLSRGGTGLGPFGYRLLAERVEPYQFKRSK